MRTDMRADVQTSSTCLFGPEQCFPSRTVIDIFFQCWHARCLICHCACVASCCGVLSKRLVRHACCYKCATNVMMDACCHLGLGRGGDSSQTTKTNPTCEYAHIPRIVSLYPPLDQNRPSLFFSVPIYPSPGAGIPQRHVMLSYSRESEPDFGPPLPTSMSFHSPQCSTGCFSFVILNARSFF